MNRGFESYSDDCLVPLTVKHLLNECPSLQELRMQFLFNSRNEDGSYSLSKILGEHFEEANVYNFLSEAGLLGEI